MEIILDHRETRLIEIFERDYPTVYQIASLSVGDIHIIDKETKQIILCIERKTVSDLYSSIRDGRHREQKKRALAHLSANQFLYCIEGSNGKIQDMRKKIVDGAILNTLFRDKLRIITTSSVMDTVQTIMNLYKKCKENPSWFQGDISVNKTQEPFNYDNLIKLHKKENMTPKICQILFLSQIPGMSQQISRQIIEYFTSVKSMIVQLSTEPDPLLILTNIELEISSGKKRKLGKVLAKRIYTCLFMDEENFL